MRVVWKRPDGFHGAVPSDFFVVDVDGQIKLWLHRREREWFPFQVTGGWQDADATRKLNRLVNLLAAADAVWVNHLLNTFNDSLTDNPNTFFDETIAWLNNDMSNLKGDTWEVEVMEKIMSAIQERLQTIRPRFEQQAQTGAVV